MKIGINWKKRKKRVPQRLQSLSNMRAYGNKSADKIATIGAYGTLYKISFYNYQ